MRSSRHVLLKYFTSPAYFHLILPTGLDLPPADRAADTPAILAGFKFPRQTIFPDFFLTLHYCPAGLGLLIRIPLQCEKKRELPFNMHGNIPPSLFKTLHGFQGNTQQLGYLALWFSKMLTNLRKLGFIHTRKFRLNLRSRLFNNKRTDWLYIIFSSNSPVILQVSPNNAGK